jgi:hypothetical protein
MLPEKLVISGSEEFAQSLPNLARWYEEVPLV